jgi:hypothetical protein
MTSVQPKHSINVSPVPSTARVMRNSITWQFRPHSPELQSLQLWQLTQHSQSSRAQAVVAAHTNGRRTQRGKSA